MGAWIRGNLLDALVPSHRQPNQVVSQSNPPIEAQSWTDGHPHFKTAESVVSTTALFF